MQVVETRAPCSSKSLGLFRSLGAKLHHEINERIRTEREDDDDPRVSPSIVVCLEVDGGEVVASVTILADATVRSRMRINQIAVRTTTFHVRGEILSTSGAIRGIENSELLVSALDVDIVNTKDKHAAHEVVEGIDPIEPIPPEGLDSSVRDQDTTEGRQSADDQGICQSCKHGVWRVGSNELPNAGVDEFVYEHDEKHAPRFVRFARKANRVIPAHEVKHGTDAEVGHL